MIDKELLKIIEEYQNIPNAPFHQKHTSAYIKDRLYNAGIEYEETDFVIIVKPKKYDSNKRKLLLMAHTDHPGMVIKNNTEGKFLGLKNTKEIIKYTKKNDVRIKVFSPEGSLLGKAKLEKVIPGPKQDVQIKADFDIPLNSIGNFDIPVFKVGNNYIDIYNADDGIMVTILLYLIEKQLLGDSFNTYYVFIKHEEVHQLSSWDLAKNNYINLTNEDYVLNLECLKIKAIDASKYGDVSYDKGPVIQLSNTGCLFGYKNKGPNNLEKLLRKLSDENKIESQVGVITDSCDSRPFTHFAITPNIVTLTIPNKYKHNGADDGMVRTEEIYIKDINSTIELLKVLTSYSTEKYKNIQLESISEKLRKSESVTDASIMFNKALLNKRLNIAYLDIVKREYFYPQTIKDYILDFIYKYISYFVYFWTKFLK